jgi:hypothetical protein
VSSSVHPVLGAFAKLLKAIVSFVVSRRPSVRTLPQSPLDGIFMILQLAKMRKENSSLIKI